MTGVPGGVSALGAASAANVDLPGARVAGQRNEKEVKRLIILGVVLLIVGFLVKSLAVLITIGAILIVIGVVLALVGASGRAVGGRRHYY